MYKLIFGLLFVIFSIPCFGSMDLLNQPFGVRAVGMGGTYTALAIGSESIFYNYAAGPLSDYPAFKVEQGTLLETGYLALSAENIFDIPFIKYGYIYAFDQDIPYTQLDSSNHPQLTGSTFGYSSHVGLLALESEFFGVQFGMAGTAYLEFLEKSEAKSFTMGGSIQKQWDFYQNQLTTAITVKNLVRTNLYWSGDYQESIPYYYVIGGINYGSQDQKLNIGLDLVVKNASIPDAKPELYQYHFGVEYWLIKSAHSFESFCVRSGLLNGSLTLGLGLYVQGLSFDYAYILPQKNYLDQTMRFSLGYHFYPFPATPEKKKTSYISILDNRPAFAQLSDANTLNQSLSDKEKAPFSQTESMLEKLFAQKKASIPSLNIQPTENIDQLEEKAVQKAEQAYPNRKIMIATMNIPKDESLETLQTDSLKEFESDIAKQDSVLSEYVPSQTMQSKILDQMIDIDTMNKQFTIQLTASELIEKIRFGDTILTGQKTYHYSGYQNLALQPFLMMYFLPSGMITIHLKQIQQETLQKLYLDGVVPEGYDLYIDQTLQQIQTDRSFHYEVKNNLYMNPSVHIVVMPRAGGRQYH